MRRVMVMLVVLAALLSGCTCYSSSHTGDRGERIAAKEFNIWPVFEAERVEYTNGVEREGECLFIIRWSAWSPAKEVPSDASGSAGAALTSM